MKLLLCLECADIKKLQISSTSATICECGKSWGYYLNDGIRAVYGGEAIIIGMDNRDVGELIRREIRARVNPDYEILTEQFRADWFTIPEGHNIERNNHDYKKL